jgi:hypothetical protein
MSIKWKTDTIYMFKVHSDTKCHRKMLMILPIIIIIIKTNETISVLGQDTIS